MSKLWSFTLCSLWLAFNMGVTFFNKWLFSSSQFAYPVTLSALHMGAAFFGSTILSRVMNQGAKHGGDAVVVSPSIKYKLNFLSMVMAVNVALGNATILLVDITLGQIVRATTPILTGVLSWAVLGRSIPADKLGAVVFISFGCCIACYRGFEMNMLGLVVAFLGTAMCAVKAVLSQVLLHGSLGGIELLRQTSWRVAILLFAYSWISNEITEALSHIQSTLLLNVAMAFGVNILNFAVVKHTSGLTITVLGNVKNAGTAILGPILFNTAISSNTIVGGAMAFLGLAWYSFGISSSGMTKKKS